MISKMGALSDNYRPLKEQIPPTVTTLPAQYSDSFSKSKVSFEGLGSFIAGLVKSPKYMKEFP